MVSSLTTLIFKSPLKMLIIDNANYPFPHIKMTYTGIFFRKFSLALPLHASLAIKMINEDLP